MNTLCSRLRRARKFAGLTQQQLAERLGVTRTAVSQWECPEGTVPSTVNLLATARATGVHAEWLATGRGLMHTDTTVCQGSTSSLSAQEDRLLRAFRRLSSRRREALMAIFEAIA